MPLAWRIFLIFALLTGLALGTAAFVTYRQGEHIANAAVEQALQASAEVQGEFTQRRLEEAQLKVQTIAADPAFVQYVADAQGGGLGLGTEGVPDAGSIVDLLNERKEAYDFDLGVVLDAEGDVLARTDQTEALEQTLAQDPFVMPVIEELKPVGGFWRQGDKLYQAAMVPLAQKDDLVGFLLVALEVDNELGAKVGKVSGADIAFLLPTAEEPALIGTSLDQASAEALSAAITSGAGGIKAALAAGQPLERVNLPFGGHRWIGRLAPVDADGGTQLGATLQLTSADRAAAGYREILNLVLLVALVALLVAVPVSFLLAKATLRPLSTMARAAKEAAAGNYQTRMGIAGSDELAQLSHAFDSLLSDLREKSDMAGYVTNISRYLPDPAQETATPNRGSPQPRPGASAASASDGAPPVQENLVLLGVDLRQFAGPLEAQTPKDAMEAFNQLARKIESSARKAGGRFITAGGTRLIFGFGKEQALLGALNVARDALKSDAATALALLEGPVVTGTFSTGNTVAPTVFGPASNLLERLLGESSAGRILLPRGLGDAAKALLGDAHITVVQGILSGKPFYSATLESLGSLPAPAPATDLAPEEDEGSTLVQPAVALATRPTRGADLQSGTRFGGRYEILSVLGSGGMGVVYKARDLELDDVVALKMLKPAALVDAEHLERLKSEIKLARKITHPNVLRTFDFGEYEGLPYISMEYVRGLTLRYLLKQGGGIPYSAALRIARQLSAGLAAAHEVGVLHRDIKPENLILEQSGNAKLMDFGIARPIMRSAPGHTQPGMFVGTPHYSSPEQLAGDEVDARTDVYSSGVLLCEMFCGKLPFTGANTMEIYLAQMQSAPIRPSEHWSEIPPALEALILKCLERDAAKRYQSSAELGAALAEMRA